MSIKEELKQAKEIALNDMANAMNEDLIKLKKELSVDSYLIVGKTSQQLNKELTFDDLMNNTLKE